MLVRTSVMFHFSFSSRALWNNAHFWAARKVFNSNCSSPPMVAGKYPCFPWYLDYHRQTCLSCCWYGLWSFPVFLKSIQKVNLTVQHRFCNADSTRQTQDILGPCRGIYSLILHRFHLLFLGQELLQIQQQWSLSHWWNQERHTLLVHITIVFSSCTPKPKVKQIFLRLFLAEIINTFWKKHYRHQQRQINLSHVDAHRVVSGQDDRVV